MCALILGALSHAAIFRASISAAAREARGMSTEGCGRRAGEYEMSAVTARVSAYSCLRTLISDRLGGRLVLKLFLQSRMIWEGGGSADAIFSRPCGQSGR